MLLCVTGPMAAGKNVASDILAQMGFAVADADALVHQVLESESVKAKIKETFYDIAEERGVCLFSSDGILDRRALGRLIFGDKDLVSKQETIVYEELNKILDKFIEDNKGKNALINAAVLYKVPAVKKVDMVLYVDCPWFIRLFRAKKRDGMSILHIVRRFKSQRNLFSKYKKSNADTVRVWNVGSRDALSKKIKEIL